jgi:hypothetical protein
MVFDILVVGLLGMEDSLGEKCICNTREEKVMRKCICICVILMENG